MTSFEVGIIKAPFMALAIGIVACSEGLRVKGSAEFAGRQTTMPIASAMNGALMMPTSKLVTDTASCSRAIRSAATCHRRTAPPGRRHRAPPSTR